MSRISFLVTLLICWIPGGLIHYGQRAANPKAEAISATSATLLVISDTACSPRRWEDCRR